MLANQNLSEKPITEPDTANDEDLLAEDAGKGSWRESFRAALDAARRQQKPENRKDLSRDKSKALLLVLGASLALLLIFFDVFSRPERHTPLPGKRPGSQINSNRNDMQRPENDQASERVAPLLSADVRSTDPGAAGQVTPEDVDQTARTAAVPRLPPVTAPAKGNDDQDHSLGKVDFSDPGLGNGNSVPYPPPEPGPGPMADLKKPSLVFVLATETRPAVATQTLTHDEHSLVLPVGTRLFARLQAPVSSAIAAPAVAVVEYNYERDGQIVLPAGAKVIGKLARVSSSGYVDIHFSEIEMPDGSVEKIDASAMGVNYGPLKGEISGKRAGARFLVRSLTGIGTIASYVVGSHGSSSDGLISANALMRERLADNIASAGQEQMNSLAFNPTVVVTVPGNTRFCIVVQRSPTNQAGTGSARNSARINEVGAPGMPSLEELRQLLELRREINELYTEGSTPKSNQSIEQ